MSRLGRPIPTAPRRLNWKLALPALGLAACAAFYAHAGSARAATVDEEQHFSISHGDPDNGYALVRETAHGTNMSGDSVNWKDIEAAKRSIKGEFLWFRKDGKAWVVQDKDVLSRAEAAWAPVDKLGQQMDAYGQQMNEHGKKMEALGKEMAHAAVRFQPDEARMHEFEHRMEALGHRMEQLGERMDGTNDAERDRLQRKMDRLAEQMSAMGRRMGRQQASAHTTQASMDEVGSRMREASKPMDELGKQMGALGKQMERESHKADKVVRGLIREAVAKGLAQPAPAQG